MKKIILAMLSLGCAASAWAEPVSTGGPLTRALLAGMGAGGAASVAVSPESLRVALGMALEGAPEDLAPAFPLLSADLPRPESPSLSGANALWLDAGATPVADFDDRLAKRWGAAVEWANFSDPAAATAEINAWAAEHTEGAIAALLEGLPDNVELVLTNALLFKGAWRWSFDPEETAPGEFHLAGGETVEAAMMQVGRSFSADEHEAGVLVRLPFDDPDLAMTLLLPKADAEAALDLLATVADAPFTSTFQARIILPRFTVESGGELSATLAQAGFGPLLDAPLSRATEASPRIAAVIQQARVEVDETGARAAAATAVIATRSLRVETPREVRFDRPFYFLITHRDAAAPLFAGYVADPR